MKKAFILLTIIATLSACKSKSGSGSASPGGSDTSQGSGGGTGTPAKSNLDTTNDSTHMPAHVDSAGKKP